MSTQDFADRTPREEVAKRVAESGAGLATAAHGVAVANFARNTRDYAQRVRESQRLGNQVLADGKIDPQSLGEDDMGDINLVVTGDLYGDKAVEAVKGKQAAEMPADSKSPSLFAKAAPYLLAAVLGATGGIGALLPSILNRDDPPAAADTDTTRRVEVEKWIPGE